MPRRNTHSFIHVTGPAILLICLSLCGYAATQPPEGSRQETDVLPFRWPAGQLGAVTLSYDDAIVSHFQSVAPQLEKAGLRATFYVTVGNPRFGRNIDQWRSVARAGHELGNHTLFHPCRKDAPGQRAWLADDYNLSAYTANRWLGEMRVANLILQLVDGKTERTFGNTCCDNYLGPLDNTTCLEELIPKLFVGARGELISEMIDPANANLPALGHYNGDRKSFEQLRQEIETAVREGKWIFYMFHGVGKGTHNLYIKAEEHRKLVEYLGANKERIWTAPAVDVVRHLRTVQNGSR